MILRHPDVDVAGESATSTARAPSRSLRMEGPRVKGEGEGGGGAWYTTQLYMPMLNIS